ncbi:MAG: FtsW/RodA/SpoVE family cell cycle protein [Firmicutes bacterium]|nr:FtsW/RodA/SpoVE family cell cycle protein [Bacillota bacterium]
MSSLKDILKAYDYLLAVAVIAIGVFGIFMIYAFGNGYGTPISVNAVFGGLWTRQRIYIISGTVLMIIFSFIDYRFITRFYLYIYGFMMALLIVVMIIGADDGTNVARWIRIPIPGLGDISMQPSEFAKLFMILFLAKFFDIKKETFNHVLWLGLVLILIVVPVFFVMRQPSLSASLVVLSLSITILFVAGLYYRTILIGLVLMAPVAIMTWLDLQRAEPLFLTEILGEFQWRRIETWRNPVLGCDHFMQTQQSLYAISSGGLTGRGFLNNSHVIHGHNDFIFSLVANQFGFVGGAIVLGAMAFIIARCILIALRAADMEGRLIAAGVAGMLIFESFVHVSVTTNFLPNTGMPFPFLSFGGSMIWVHMMAIGIVLNVGLPRKKTMFNDEN